MEGNKLLIKNCFTYDLYDYIDLNDDEIKPYISLIKNWSKVKQILLHKSIKVNGKNYTPTEFTLYALEADAMIELLDGSMFFRGSAEIKGFDSSIALVVNVKDFNVYEVTGMSMGGEDFPDDFEILMIDNGKIIASVDSRAIKAGPQTYNTEYRMTFRGTI